nr:tegument protein VP13/14 UL47 [Psittacid alphaherpesvirus 6]
MATTTTRSVTSNGRRGDFIGGSRPSSRVGRSGDGGYGGEQRDRTRDRSELRGGPPQSGWDNGSGSSGQNLGSSVLDNGLSSTSRRRHIGGNRLGRQPPNRNNYVPPDSMEHGPYFDVPFGTSDDESNRDPDRHRYSDSSDGDMDTGEVVFHLPPAMNGLLTAEEFNNRIPMNRAISGSLEDEVLTSERLLSSRVQEFGGQTSWGERIKPPYPRGNLYWSDPGDGKAAWTSTAMQASAIVLTLTRDSLREAVDAVKMKQSTAVLFLVDAMLRITACLQKRQFGPYVVRNPIPEIMKLLTEQYPDMLMDVPTEPARGVTASVLRSSLGSICYWPHVRSNLMLTPMSEKVPYCITLMQKQHIFLASRCVRTGCTLTDFDLDALAESFSATTVAALIALEFLYLLTSKMLSESDDSGPYEQLTDIEALVRYPMGSKELMVCESMCFGDLDNRGDLSTGVAASALMTHVGVRSVFTELMVECAEGIQTPVLERNAEQAMALMIGTMLLQRLLGSLNVTACYLVSAALFNGREVMVRSGAFDVLAFLFGCCSSLYRPVTVDEYFDDVDKAMKDLGLAAVSGNPPGRGNSITPINTSEMSAFRLSDLNVFERLGDRVPLSSALGPSAKYILLGPLAVETALTEVKGSRQRLGEGSGNFPRRLSSRSVYQ